MKINIIGDGSAGQRHARLLRQRGHVCDILGPDRASPVQHPECDAVVIASPPLTHKLYLAWYWDRCPILCEGPVTWIPPKNDFPHMYAANWTFVPQVRHLKKLIQEKGQPVIAHLWFDYDLALWRPNVDYRVSCYFTDGIDFINHHEAATAIHLFGPFQQVSVAKGSSGKSLGTDALVLSGRHSGGTLTTINSSWHSSQYQRGIRTVFKDGTSYEVNWTTPQDDWVVNQSYERVIDSWLDAIQNYSSNAAVMLDYPKPSLLLGYRAFKALQGEVV